MQRNKNQIRLIVSALAITIACVCLPFFSYYYRMFMIPYAFIGFLIFFDFSAKKISIKRERIVGVIIILVAAFVVIANYGITTYVICLAVIICILIVRNSNQGITLAVLTSIISISLQSKTVWGFYSSYQKASSGLIDVPAHIPELMQNAMVNEAGMLAVIFALNIILFSAVLNKPKATREDEKDDGQFTENITGYPVQHLDATDEQADYPHYGTIKEKMNEGCVPILQKEGMLDTQAIAINFCRFCGKKIPSDSVFCPYCGKTSS